MVPSDNCAVTTIDPVLQVFRDILASGGSNFEVETLIEILENAKRRIEVGVANPAHVCESLMGYYWSFQSQLAAVGASGHLRTLCFDLGYEFGISRELLLDMDQNAQNLR